MTEDDATKGTGAKEVLSYAPPAKDTTFRAWVFLVLSIVPLVVTSLLNSMVIGGERMVWGRMVDQLQMAMPRRLAFATVVTLTVLLPFVLGFAFSWIAQREFQQTVGTAARVGKFLSWTACVLYGGLIVAAVAATAGAIVIMIRS
jgi:hypothetical protein